MNEARRDDLFTFKVKVKDVNPVHTRIVIYAGRLEGSLALTGELCLRNDEAEAFREVLVQGASPSRIVIWREGGVSTPHGEMDEGR